MSCPSLRPHCGLCVQMMKRVYVRDAIGKFRGIGWICPLCRKFHDDIVEFDRQNQFRKEKVPDYQKPEPFYIFDKIHPSEPEYD